VFSSTSNLPASMAFTLLVSLLALALLFATLCKYELTAKHTRAQLRALRRRLAGEADVPRGTRSSAPSAHSQAAIRARVAGGGAPS